MMFLLEKKIAFVTFQDVEGVCLWIMTGLLQEPHLLFLQAYLYFHTNDRRRKSGKNYSRNK
jgi:hypothetical protein